ncbi:MAG: helix-hairpin-helix domain-containing protein [Anaerolineae bacterium]|nr:helix-hairpin-helix domain-containing protein [Anaerolineae bacterium]
MTVTLADIRRFLVDFFSDEELTGFCFDRFHEVYQNFTTDMTVGRKALQLVDYCQRRDLIPALLAALRTERPEPYRRVFGGETKPTVQRVNLNEATVEEMMNLPGIGQALAAAIVAARPFSAVDELTRIPGIGPKRLTAMRDWCNV